MTNPTCAHLFTYQAYKHGIPVKGEIAALTIKLAKAQLQRQGLQQIKIQRKYALRGRLSHSALRHFTRQLATLLLAGIPLVQALDTLAKTAGSGRELFLTLKAQVEAGYSFWETLRHYPRHFDLLFCHLVQVGEMSGTLALLLEKIASYQEKSAAIKQKIKKALLYPSLVIIIGVGITALLLLLVVPQFEQLFKQFNAALPPLTQLIIDLSTILKIRGWMILGILTAILSAIIYAHRHHLSVQIGLDKLLLKLPLLGKILHYGAIGRYARTLAITLSAGLPLMEALSLVAAATGNRVYERALHQIKQQISNGISLHLAMQYTHLFPLMVIQMVAIGEESGSLDTLLAKTASFFEEQLATIIENLSTILEPLIMIIIGLLVGTLVIAMYLPIIKLGAVI